MRKSASKIKTLQEAQAWLSEFSEGKTVFTNGCFDILHAGHVSYLEKARLLGDRMILGLNTDDSIKRLKGPDRPINSEADRAQVLAALESIDCVILFGEDTPLDLMKTLKPAIIAKGEDYDATVTDPKHSKYIVAANEVKTWGGEARTIAFVDGRSTTNTITKIKRA